MNFRDLLNVIDQAQEQPQIGDVIELECGDILIETVITEVGQEGVGVHLDEAAWELLLDSSTRLLEGKTGPGLWANMRDRRESGKRMRKPGEKGAPTEKALKAARAGSKNESVEDVAEGLNKTSKITFAQQTPGSNTRLDILVDGVVKFQAVKTMGPGHWFIYTLDNPHTNIGDGTNKTELKTAVLDYLSKQSVAEDTVDEAKYRGREVPLGKPMAGDVAKRKVYVRGPKGNVVKVNFGQKGVKIKKNNPARRKSFRARHGCDNPGPRWRAKYWSCKMW